MSTNPSSKSHSYSSFGSAACRDDTPDISNAEIVTYLNKVYAQLHDQKARIEHALLDIDELGEPATMEVADQRQAEADALSESGLTTQAALNSLWATICLLKKNH